MEKPRKIWSGLPNEPLRVLIVIFQVDEKYKEDGWNERINVVIENFTNVR